MGTLPLSADWFDKMPAHIEAQNCAEVDSSTIAFASVENLVDYQVASKPKHRDSRMLEQYVKRIERITLEARSETSLQVKLEPLLTDLLREFKITYKASVNETLKSLGISQADSTRPDSLFGHVVLDYKSPG